MTAVNTAVFALNGSGPSSIDGKTPFELFTNRSVNFEVFHVFGTECYLHVPGEEREKWNLEGGCGVFVGVE